ncbi:hypothetical protein [Microbispora sp. KK1-11]|uniref:hypothetical protein n=1 Tax=Microbispora sp. KK1-11 TaxID=2053005 RepID=UPI001C8EE7CA|nr:hypothetical protein [Microbispora sp. KK1-11]
MTEQAFTPALGRFAPTRFYDPVVTLTRERLWRALTVMHVAPRPENVIVDAGCGTGSTALLLNRTEPRAPAGQRRAQLAAGQAAQPLRGHAHPRGQLRHRDRPVRQRVHRREQPGVELVRRPRAGEADIAEEDTQVGRRRHPMPHHGRHHQRHGAVTEPGGVHHGGLTRDGDDDLESGVAVKAAVPRRPLIERLAVTDVETRRHSRRGEGARCGVHQTVMSSFAFEPAATGCVARHRRVVVWKVSR